MSDPRIYAVAGHPVLHSRSPDLFQAGFKAVGFPGRYIRLAARDAAEILALAEMLRLEGVNVTSPFKETIVPLLSSLDPAARRLGAVNTIVRKDGGWVGGNSDPEGVIGALEARGAKPRGQRVVILGAGGAGRAAAYGLSRVGAEVVIINRTPEKAERAARDFGCQWEIWGRVEREIQTADIIVSCLPVRDRIADPELLDRRQVVVDARYPRSILAQDARSRGCSVISGEDWLLNQAFPAFERFTGLPAPRQAMEKALSEESSSIRKPGLALIGFMGAGKSTIGALLSRKEGWVFEDTDALIEKRTGLSISRLFALAGETAFRDLETCLLRTLEFGRGRVASLGGGIVLDRENRDLIRRKAVTFWVLSDPDRAAARLADGSRPLLAGADSAEKAGVLFRERLGLYAETADAVVFNTEGTGGPEAAAERIIDEIHRLVAD
jgi:shikimate dehydrogenase